MGNGIAHVCALAGYKVLLNDISPERIEAGIKTIESNLARQISKGAIKEEQKKPALAAIKPAPTLADLKIADLVIEAASENEAVKKKIFADLGAIVRDERHHCFQHVVDFDHAPCSCRRKAGALYRHSFHKSCAADAAG